MGMGNMSFGMNGMSGIQLPFPFFPPFGCDTICQPIQLQVFQQQQVQEVVTKATPTTQAPSKRFIIILFKTLPSSTV